MKRLTLLFATLTLTLSGMSGQTAKAPAFPGAEGHGRYVTGGRGGNIIHVTNLNDNGAGSLREAVKGSSKKTIVFDVAGVIALNSNLNIGDNTTILGQTAPEPGITVRYYTVQPGNNNIIRFIRFRRGQERDVNDGADAIWQRYKTGIMLDHCSFSWSIDEVASFYDNNNFTMQWCTIAESLCNAGHEKGAHGYGGIWGGKLASFHHNMIAHVNNRGPRFNGARYEWKNYTSNYDYATYKWNNFVEAENVDFRNCLMYNAQGTCYGGPGGGQINMVNNYYKCGPRDAGTNESITQVSIASSGNSSKHPNIFDMTSRYYIKGNTTETLDGNRTENKDWAGVIYDNGTLVKDGDHYSKDPNRLYPSTVPSVEVEGVRWVRIRMDDPCPTGNMTTHTADVAYEKVLSYAGASLHRDEVDERYASECREGTATYKGSVTGKWGLIDLVSDVKGYTENTFAKASHPSGYDTDGDGMPDEWEKQWGLDPDNAADAKTYTLDADRRYYTNLEMYANSLVEDIMKGGTTDGDSNYEEYWPELKSLEKDDPQPGGDDPAVTGEEIILTLDASTCKANSNDLCPWMFGDNDYTLSMTDNASKKYQTGKENGIKYSANVQYTITLPKGVTVREITFKGYDNYDDADSYLSEVCGKTFGKSEYIFPRKDASGAYQVVTHTIPVTASGTVTFTPAGKQVVFSVTLLGTVASGISGVSGNQVSSSAVYNIGGQRVSEDYWGIKVSRGKKRVSF